MKKQKGNEKVEGVATPGLEFFVVLSFPREVEEVEEPTSPTCTAVQRIFSGGSFLSFMQGKSTLPEGEVLFPDCASTDPFTYI